MTVLVKKMNMDREPPDGRAIVQRVLNDVVGPVDHLVEGWTDPPDLFVEHRLRVQRDADMSSEPVDIYLNDSTDPVGTLGSGGRPKEVPFNDVVTDTVRMEVVPHPPHSLEGTGFGR